MFLKDVLFIVGVCVDGSTTDVYPTVNSSTVHTEGELSKVDIR